MTDSQDAPVEPSGPYGVGPFTVREVALLGVWLLAFVVSFFPVDGPGSPSVWTSGLVWILTIGVPTAAVALIVLRRFSPDGIRRVGSLGIDQFASVAFSVSAVVWLGYVWSSVAVAIQVGGAPGGWVEWVELILMLAGVVLTVVAPLLPVLGEDFVGRREVPAHRNARPVRAVVPRPARERAPKPPREPKPARRTADDQQPYAPAPYAAPAVNDAPQGWDPQSAQSAPGYAPQQGYDTAAYAPQTWNTGQAYDAPAPVADERPYDGYVEPREDTGGYEPVAAAPAETQSAPAVQQAFWALAPVEREVVDQNGVPLFRIGPTAWALVIEDRGSMFVVRDEDGRTGYLLDVSGVMRG